jgi:hypothetical protein
MKKLLLILLCLPFIGFGQGWEKNFGGPQEENGTSVQQTTDGGYIITGSGPDGCLLIKTDGNGIEQWNQTFSVLSEYSGGYSVQQTTDGGYIICGWTRHQSSTGTRVYLIKTDDNGIKQWEKVFLSGVSTLGYSVQQTTDGGYIICGWTEPTSSQTNKTWVYLIKTTFNGIEQWNQTFSSDWQFGLDKGFSIQQTTDDGYIITGYTNSWLNDVYLIKTDGNGDSLWTKTFGGINEDYGYSVQQTTDGGYIICGYTESFGSVDKDVYLIKTDGNGTEQWSKTLGGTGIDLGRSVQQTTDGGYIITGGTSSFGNGSMDVYLIKTDGNGVEQWNQTFGGTEHDEGFSVQQTTDGGYIITGRTASYGNVGNGSGNLYLIKTDGNGNTTSTFNIPINPNRKLKNTVDILGRETKQTNQPLFYIYDDGTVDKRIVIE